LTFSWSSYWKRTSSPSRPFVEAVTRRRQIWPVGFDLERTERSLCRVVVAQQATGLEVNGLSIDRLAGAHCLARLSVSWTEVTSLGEFLLEHMDHEAMRAGVGSGGADKSK
jgi:hypothetical protein